MGPLDQRVRRRGGTLGRGVGRRKIDGLRASETSTDGVGEPGIP